MKNRSVENTSVALGTFLPWLVEMGADEVLRDEPVNRLLAQSPMIVETAPTVLMAPIFAGPAKPVPLSEVIDPTDIVAAADRCLQISDIAAALAEFVAHPLKKTATRLCFLAGAPNARILVLADKPRNDEDRSGAVLAGKHQVLAERLLAAIGLCGVEPRQACEQVVLANFMPWRPPGNRAVTQQEVQLIMPFVHRLLELLAPKLILCFGALPGQYLAGGDDSITRARGKWLVVQTASGSIPLLTTFHPETLLKSPQSKRLAWSDLQTFRNRLAEVK